VPWRKRKKYKRYWYSVSVSYWVRCADTRYTDQCIISTSLLHSYWCPLLYVLLSPQRTTNLKPDTSTETPIVASAFN